MLNVIDPPIIFESQSINTSFSSCIRKQRAKSTMRFQDRRIAAAYLSGITTLFSKAVVLKRKNAYLPYRYYEHCLVAKK
jgi:hypothetical protein